MVRRSSPTDDAVKLVRGLSGTHKIVIGIVATVAALYGGVKFVADQSADKALTNYEKERQKIGRPEYARYKEETQKKIERLEAQIDELHDHVIRIEAKAEK
jgi:molecular chaperone GrpE (heat shock protein)